MIGETDNAIVSKLGCRANRIETRCISVGALPFKTLVFSICSSNKAAPQAFFSHRLLICGLPSEPRVEQMQFRPTNITLNKSEKTLEIVWDDGLRSQYPLSQLREACPCVECRGGHANMGMANAPDDLLQLVPQRSHAITGLRPVGNYALQPSWDDGHETGIYTWEYLRLISPQE